MERMEKKIYEFTNDGNSCVIYDAKPPRYWFNYLWNENGYCAQVSQNGHGRSYYLNERADMCMINNNDARYFYIRDDEMNKSWNIGAAPLNEQVESYQCEHSIGFSRLQSECQGIESSWRIFVPQTGFQEVWTFRLRNKSDRARMLSTFSAVTFELEGFSYPRYYEMYRCLETSFDRELNGIYCRSAHPFAPHKRYNAYLASSEPVYAYDGDLARFCGAAGSVTKLDASAYALFQRPDVVVNGGDCTNSEAALFILGGVLQHKFILQPGETKEIRMVFGVSESLDEARAAFEKVKELTIRLSMVENSAYRLAVNIKKTQKRANALKNITIPKYEALTKSISNALEEKEREEFTRLKVIKRMQSN